MLWIKKNIRNFLLLLVLWNIITINILRFNCVELTETQLFLKIPKSIILNFDCK